MMLDVAIRHRLPDFELDARFQAPAGVTALFGKSGAGKTTVVSTIAGLMRPDHARISVDGTTLIDSETGVNLPPHRRGIGYVFQEARLFPHLNVRANLLYGRRLSRLSGPPPRQIIQMLGIEHLLHRRPAALSGGEKSRVAIGRAILSNPRLLVMDEPLAALDQPRKDEILPYLERLRDQIGLPILYVSHALPEVARLATSIVLIDNGRVAAAGPAGEILCDPRHAPLLGSRQMGAILTARLSAQEADGLSRLDCATGPIWVPRVAAETGRTMRLRIMAHDVMLSLTPPQGISALNVLPARIVDLHGDQDGVLVQLDTGGQGLLARVTARSAAALALRPGLQVHAILKAVSVTAANIGGAG
ncbi:molybdenum ABC transporter ATP-binding protein [Paracoccus homiensis]|uniref:molybdenum ABC transporter ATP-binding protein n=1 Tax=Paracoccus homiensis TaxID=364199 RepID=UPI00398D17C0